MLLARYKLLSFSAEEGGLLSSFLPSVLPSQLSPVNRRLVTNYITFRAPSPPSPRAKPSVRPFVSGGVWRMMFLVPALAAHAPALIPARLPFPLPRIYRGHLEPANFQLSPVFVRDSELWASKIFHIFLAGRRTGKALFSKKYFSARSQPAWFCDAIYFHSVTIHSSPSSSALLLTPELRLIYPVGPSVSSAFPRLSPFEALQTAACLRACLVLLD